jgi:hypothetical protein
VLCLAAILVVACSAMAPPAEAAKARATYTTSLLGFTVATSELDLAVVDGAYDMNLAVRTAGLARVFTGFSGTARVQGRLQADRAVPSRFTVDARAGDDHYDIELGFTGSDVTSRRALPPHDPHPDLVPIDARASRGVTDPLSAFLAPTPRGDLRRVCERRLPIFTGRDRFDLQLAFDRFETVRVDGVRPSQAIVCSARYIPIQGHRTERDEPRYMSENRDLFAWFVPIEGSDLLALFRVRVGTRIGAVVVQLDTLEGDGIPVTRRRR